LRIPGPGTSRHILDHEGKKIQFFPDRVCSLNIDPSFDGGGLLAVFESRSLVRCAFLYEEEAEDSETNIIVADCLFKPEEWENPVIKAIHAIDLLPTPDRTLPEGASIITLDGIGYKLRLTVQGVHLSICFTNPWQAEYKELENTCYYCGRTVATKPGNRSIDHFMNVWESYIHDR
jgi:hypothetical protein